MNKGTVKWFNNQKGFGFIAMEDGTDIFVHYSGIISDEKRKTLTEGQTVTFNVKETEKGNQAINVTVIEVDIKNNEEMEED